MNMIDTTFKILIIVLIALIIPTPLLLTAVLVVGLMNLLKN